MTTIRPRQSPQTYVIGMEGSPLVKIGTAANPNSRLATLQTGQPAPLSLLWTCEGDRALEKAVHVRLAAYRTRGEWFDLTALGDPVDAVRAAVKAVHADARAAARSAKRAAARREQLDADPSVAKVEYDKRGREVITRWRSYLANADDEEFGLTEGTPVMVEEVHGVGDDGRPRVTVLRHVVLRLDAVLHNPRKCPRGLRQG
ncbi:GIY-YIG nuclease family protein [Streptomyces virginiae]|uniref:GIY-YIG nuclease family protein n=1 Tax=Streptomyces virginiae TaxID=1961 RepID=UPI0036BBEF0C